MMIAIASCHQRRDVNCQFRTTLRPDLSFLRGEGTALKAAAKRVKRF
jgi:hypothetical protein